MWIVIGWWAFVFVAFVAFPPIGGVLAVLFVLGWLAYCVHGLFFGGFDEG